MKTKLSILTLGLLVSLFSVQAETVYLQDALTQATLLKPANGGGLVGISYSTVPIEDARGISSVTIEPFFKIYDSAGQIIAPDTGIGFVIYLNIGANGHPQIFWQPGISDSLVFIDTTLEVDSDHPLGGPDRIGFAPNLAYDDGGPDMNRDYLAAHVAEEQTWHFGFDVLSYEPIPEPTTWMLIALGCFGLLALRRPD